MHFHKAKYGGEGSCLQRSQIGRFYCKILAKWKYILINYQQQP